MSALCLHHHIDPNSITSFSVSSSSPFLPLQLLLYSLPPPSPKHYPPTHLYCNAAYLFHFLLSKSLPTSGPLFSSSSSFLPSGPPLRSGLYLPPSYSFLFFVIFNPCTSLSLSPSLLPFLFSLHCGTLQDSS